MKISFITLLDEGMATCTFDADITWLPLDPATKPFARQLPTAIKEIMMDDGKYCFRQTMPYSENVSYEAERWLSRPVKRFRRLFTPFAEWILEL